MLPEFTYQCKTPFFIWLSNPLSFFRSHSTHGKISFLSSITHCSHLNYWLLIVGSVGERLTLSVQCRWASSSLPPRYGYSSVVTFGGCQEDFMLVVHTPEEDSAHHPPGTHKLLLCMNKPKVHPLTTWLCVFLLCRRVCWDEVVVGVLFRFVMLYNAHHVRNQFLCFFSLLRQCEYSKRLADRHTTLTRNSLIFKGVYHCHSTAHVKEIYIKVKKSYCLWLQ